MVYTPKYYTDLNSAKGIVKSNLRADLQASVDGILEEAIEMAEMYTDHFLVSSGFDLNSLTTRQKTDARNLSTANALIYLTGVLPITTEEKRDYLTQHRERLEEAEKRFIRREFPSADVESKYGRMEPGYGREWDEEE